MDGAPRTVFPTAKENEKAAIQDTCGLSRIRENFCANRRELSTKCVPFKLS